MHPNYTFCLDMAAQTAPAGRILDYGCGAGDTVEAGLARGLDIYGTDVFFDCSPQFPEQVRAKGLIANGRVIAMKDGRIPFPDHRFDFICHNQVFEHVPDLDVALAELRRVLRPQGEMLSIFPTRETLREGHCGVPLAHRFRTRSRLRRAYMLLWRRLGGGTNHEGRQPAKWTDDFCGYLDQYCFYRTVPELAKAYERAGFTFEGHEAEFARYRLRNTRLRAIAPLPTKMPSATRMAMRRLSGVVLLSR